jgi:chromosome segregation ATPase
MYAANLPLNSDELFDWKIGSNFRAATIKSGDLVPRENEKFDQISELEKFTKNDPLAKDLAQLLLDKHWQLENMQNFIDEKDWELFDLAAGKNTLEVKVDALKKELASLKNAETTLKKERDTLKKERDSLKSTGTTLKKERDAFKKERDSLKTTKTTMEKEISKLRLELKSKTVTGKTNIALPRGIAHTPQNREVLPKKIVLKNKINNVPRGTFLKIK